MRGHSDNTVGAAPFDPTGALRALSDGGTRAGEDEAGGRFLLCQVGAKICALPVEVVDETMRPLPIEPLAGVASFVLGVAVIRGAPTPVIDGLGLLGHASDLDDVETAPRFVTIEVGGRRVALLVDRVLGIRSLSSATLFDISPLLRGAHHESVAALGALDAALLVVLEASHMVPDDVWAQLESREARP